MRASPARARDHGEAERSHMLNTSCRMWTDMPTCARGLAWLSRERRLADGGPSTPASFFTIALDEDDGIEAWAVLGPTGTSEAAIVNGERRRSSSTSTLTSTSSLAVIFFTSYRESRTVSQYSIPVRESS